MMADLMAQTAVHNLKTIMDIRKDDDHDLIPDQLGAMVTVAGRVTVSTSVLDTVHFDVFIQDHTGGINLYNDSLGFSLARGDSVVVNGIVDQANGMACLKVLNSIKINTQKHIPKAYSIDLDLKNAETYEGMLVRLQGHILKKERIVSGDYLMLHLENNEIILVFKHKNHSLGLDFDQFELRDNVQVTGILGQYDRTPPFDGGYQIYLRDANDISSIGFSYTFYKRASLIGSLLLLVIMLWNLLLNKRVRHRTRELETRTVELGKTVEALKIARKEAIEATRLKGEFLANMSHEIRTPMNGILGVNELLLSTKLNAEQEEYVETIRFSAESLLGIINDILDFSKIEAGKLAMETIEFNLPELVENIISMISLQIQQKGLDFIVDIDEAVHSIVLGDPTRIRQVLLNMLCNALKFTKSGSIILQVSLQQATPLFSSPHKKTLPEQNNILFSVKDSGIGISKEKQALIFESFAQADGSTTRQYGGSGLGLTISKQLVNMMNGQIGVDSEKDKGSNFWFTIPLPEKQIDPQFANLLNRIDQQFKNMAVLIVDENRVLLEHYDKMFAKYFGKVMLSTDISAMDKILCEMNVKTYPVRLMLLDDHVFSRRSENVVKFMEKHCLQNVPVFITETKYTMKDKQKYICQENVQKVIRKPLTTLKALKLLAKLVDTQLEGQQTDNNAISLNKKKMPGGVFPLPLNVLVAEDNLVNQKLVKRILEKNGYTVQIAANGAEAVTALDQKQFDLILMDMQMPVMDGIEATLLIRKKEKVIGSHTPIIALTANAMTGDRERCMAAGMDEYIAKPVKSKQLLEKIQHIFNQSNLPDADQKRLI